ncbi:MAG: hypothetical protein EOO20_02875 [Chryseobacterium sp.]|uniref:hypothetical protein n=1 Tax=Pedobacter agri TaxID=454586 RepID=UPI0012280F30|nr:hypothetical protein [Pedobacter agri]RZJ92130.1 MAG: hypothetical protein EOO20_02875 [Chryseobacterium sp.]
METNLKVVSFGPKLRVTVKRYDLHGQDLDKNQVERFCTILGRETGVAAVPLMVGNKWKSVIVEQRFDIFKKHYPVDEWVVDVIATNVVMHLNLSNLNDQQLIADLYKRALLIQIGIKTNFWTLGTPRIFYEKDPFLKNDFVKKFQNLTDIQGYRRYELSEQILDGVGLSFSVHVSTAFFTSLTVEDYFSKGHKSRFYSLAGRQREQKGTLVYDGPKGRQVCYFESYCHDKTLISSGGINGKTKRYENVYAYYQETAPGYPVRPNDKIAIVKFSGNDTKSMVPANKLFLRVMNESLDYKMSQKDKIDPQERTELINKFWQRLGNFPFGNRFAKIEQSLYQPNANNSGRIALPTLSFGDNLKLSPPELANEKTFRKHFLDRKMCLEECGCYFVPPTMEREIYFIYPEHIDQYTCDFFADKICEKITLLTKINVEPVIKRYKDYMDAASDLSMSAMPGMVVFAFDEVDSVSYFNIRYELSDWRLKRLTSRSLQKAYNSYRDYKDGKSANVKGLRNWETYIDENTYDILQQLGCLPYVTQPQLHYDMQLVIDVSAKSTYLALSLFMYKTGMDIPVSAELIKPKTDTKKEEINKVFLEKYLKQLLLENRELIMEKGMRSMLVLRDGKDCGEEYEAIANIVEQFKKQSIFPPNFRCDFVEYHKSSQKQIRIWDKNGHLKNNCLEGSYFLLDEQTAILNTTGAGTLNQGTAAPIMIKNKYTNANLLHVLTDIFTTSQLNFSSPRVAQRLTFPAKRTDEQLKDRMAQEILRIK